jgi:hypothetical protein
MTRVLAALFVLSISVGFVPRWSGLDLSAAAAQSGINIGVVNDSGFHRQFTVVDEVCGRTWELSLAPGNGANLTICASSGGAGTIKYLKHGSSGWVYRRLLSNGETVRMI